MISSINLSLSTIFETERYVALVADCQKQLSVINSSIEIPLIPGNSWHSLFPLANSNDFIKIQTPRDLFSSFLS